MILGTLLASAMMTLPRLARLELMALVSLRRAPCDPESFSLSLPAKSTKLRLPAIPNTIRGQNQDTLMPQITGQCIRTNQPDSVHDLDIEF